MTTPRPADLRRPARHVPPAAGPPRSSLLRDLMDTSLAQACSLAMNAASLAVISRRLGETDLGLYTLERRGMALAQPLVLLGLTVAAPRFIARASASRPDEGRNYAAAGVAVVAAVALLAAIAMALFPAPVGAVVFGDPEAVALSRALAGFVAVTALFQVVYSTFRGYLQITRANLLEIVAVGALPLCLALFGPTDLVRFMWALNGGIFAATLISVPWTRLRLPGRSGLRGMRSAAGRMLRYGLARTPGDLAIVGMFSLAPLLVVQSSSSVEAGYASVVQSTINLVAVVAVPLGVLLLPRAAMDLEVDPEAARVRYRLLAQAALDVSLVLGGLLLLASPVFVELWVPRAPEHVDVAQAACAIGVPGYVFYVAFRSYLDADSTRPLSSIATIAGLVTLLALLPLGLALHLAQASVVASLALSIALSVTGATTLYLVRRRLHGLHGLYGWRAAAPLLGLVGVFAVVRVLLPASDIAATLAATLAGAVAVAALGLRSRRAWITELRRQLTVMQQGRRG